MKELYAYDFDKTLIPYDSFRQYLLHLLMLRPVSIGGLLVLRKMRMISSANIKKYVTKMVERSSRLRLDAKRFANQIVYDVQMPHQATTGEVTLIISASPNVYMRYVAEALGCDLLCSGMREGAYMEMFGDTKKEWLQRLYPQTEYTWMYAKSDSASDLCWMKEFYKYDIIDKQ